MWRQTEVSGRLMCARQKYGQKGGHRGHTCLEEGAGTVWREHKEKDRKCTLRRQNFKIKRGGTK